MIKKPIVAGNWKMFKTPQEGYDFVETTSDLLLNVIGVKVIFCPPFTALFHINQVLKDTPHSLGAQNVHFESSGAFTGEISVDMLQACGVEYAIIGHSERRHVFGESDEWINKKVHAALAGNLYPILCIGEKLDERQQNVTTEILTRQLKAGLKGVSAVQMESIVIAYEPVWAIGTGLTASVAQASEAHLVVRRVLSELYAEKIAADTAILYGGSVKPDNASALIKAPGVDGFLIGGASLKTDSFVAIADEVMKNYVKE